MSSTPNVAATAPVIVRRSRAAQTDLQDHAEHLSASPNLLESLGLVVGQQVRIRRNDDTVALYTVSEASTESIATVVRMGPEGRARIAAVDGSAAHLETHAVDPTLDDADAEARGEFVERVGDDGRPTGLIAIAPHGGAIEVRTDQQAERVARALGPERASSWRCKGWHPDGSAFTRWHVTSSDIHPASFPRLASVLGRRFAHAVAFHGFSPDDGTDVLIGGSAPRALKRDVRCAVADALGPGFRVRVAGPGDVFGGDDPRNIVNQLTANRRNGIQVEQSARARNAHWADIADAIADVYAERLSARVAAAGDRHRYP